MQTAVTTEAAIGRRHNLSFEEFTSEYLKPHRPVIIEDALRSWKAIGKWTPEYLRQVAGEREVKVDGKVWKVSEIIDLALEATPEKPSPYLRNTPLQDLSPTLLEDISPGPEYLSPNWLDTKFYPAKLRLLLGRAIIPDIFIGSVGRSFPFLHYDRLNSHAFLSQIYGTKLYTLYSPDQTPYMYQKPGWPNQSLVNSVDNPNLTTFPLFANAKPIQGILGPGEMAFIPAGWWHTAKMLSPSITISINVVNQSNWKGLVMEQYDTARRSDQLSHRLVAHPLAAYLRSVGLYRSMFG